LSSVNGITSHYKQKLFAAKTFKKQNEKTLIKMIGTFTKAATGKKMPITSLAFSEKKKPRQPAHGSA